jgi:endonuclease/exonuclease/phosphatase family metal-dependent hydrolase
MRDDTDALARVMHDVAADVAIIQEAPRFLRWRSKCAALARRAGMVQVAGGRTAGANLILSTLAVEVLSTRDIAYTTERNLHRRGAALAALRLRGARFAVAGTHLDLIEAQRIRHLAELAEIAAAVVPSDVPLIVGGDINAVPGSATWHRLEQFGTDIWTAVGEGDGFSYPSFGPVRRIDALIADRRIKPLRVEVPDSPDIHVATDHRPLVAEFDVPESA